MDSEFILKITWQAIKTFVETGTIIETPVCSNELKEKHGVFVTIYKNNNLRGCIGLPYPAKPLIDALIESAVSACCDPRFPSLKKEELNEIDIEVSILTKPELIQTKPENYPDKIEIGKDGLMIEYNGRSGLLLPQVATEENWNTKQFLNTICIKAGLPKNKWQDKKTKLYKFQAKIIKEKYK